ncbi:hypothetical protein TNCV_4724851 [Trichonephila clavipes]|uniref:Uncharacterized protein n=1 Tax=Trichonephila clavipes TaxID=2585209 RepID=A0A8X7BGC4_TRICX|nr:hypothetical protein TNCV_4724851 [Trichonephila clavipes]
MDKGVKTKNVSSVVDELSQQQFWIATPAALRPGRLNCTQQSKLGIKTCSSLSNYVSDNMSNEHFYEMTSSKSVW